MTLRALGDSKLHIQLGYDHMNAEFKDVRTLQNSVFQLNAAVMF